MRNERVTISGGTNKPGWLEQYDVIGKIGEGTFGVVYLAEMKSDRSKCIAIKKFRPTDQGRGVSPTAIREMKLLRETEHENVVKLLNVHINHAEMSVYLAFDYAEYELFEIIAYHRNKGFRPINPYTIKSIMWQLLDGVNYLHSNWIIHRDLKPGNILVMGAGKEFGVVKIADFGLARTYDAPLRPLSADGVVETIWYRAPELLLGSKHYTSAIDMWAVGCIFAEFFTLKPIFQAYEVPPVRGMPAPFQVDQLDKIFRVLGHPTLEKWPLLEHLPYWQANLQCIQERKYKNAQFNNAVALSPNNPEYDLLSKMLEYDPSKRITAVQALQHEYFRMEPLPGRNSLVPPQPGLDVVVYPSRLVDTRATVI